MKKEQIKRLISPIIEKYLNIFGAIVLEGPKWCGKTYIGSLYSKSQCYIQNDIEGYKLILNQELKNNPILKGETPRLIDEWQDIPRIWDKARLFIDLNFGEPGQFILTGSTRVDRSKISHSGAGRMGQIRMTTLTMFEILRMKKDENEFISLSSLFDDVNNFQNKTTEFATEWIGKQMIIGGWPSIFSSNDEDNKNNSVSKKYANSIETMDTYLEIRPRNLILRNFIKSISRLNGSQLNYSSVISDLNNEISKNTIPRYFELIESIFLIDYLESWNLNVRSKTRIQTKPKFYLCDPSIGLSILNINSYDQLIRDPRLFGIYFENQVIHDLKVFAQSINGELFFYRDENGFEIDAILQLDDGRWAPIEIKLTDSNLEQIDKSAQRLLSIENKIKTEYGLESKPSFYLIITSEEYSYKREDGVLIVPLTLLKP